MNTPIIDPSTLTEEQKKIILREYDYNAAAVVRIRFACAPTTDTYGAESREMMQWMQWHKGKVDELIEIFGEEFFKKGGEE